MELRNTTSVNLWIGLLGSIIMKDILADYQKRFGKGHALLYYQLFLVSVFQYLLFLPVYVLDIFDVKSCQSFPEDTKLWIDPLDLNLTLPLATNSVVKLIGSSLVGALVIMTPLCLMDSACPSVSAQSIVHGYHYHIIIFSPIPPSPIPPRRSFLFSFTITWRPNIEVTLDPQPLFYSQDMTTPTPPKKNEKKLPQFLIEHTTISSYHSYLIN